MQTLNPAGLVAEEQAAIVLFSSTLKAFIRLCSTFMCLIMYIVPISFKMTVVERVKLVSCARSQKNFN